MRVLSLGLVFLVITAGAIADVVPWKVDLQERARRRADPAANAARYAAAAAAGRQPERSGLNVVEGSFDPAVLAPIELIGQVVPVYNLDRERQERFRRDWTSRRAVELLGADFWEQLRGVLAPAIAAEHESRRIGAMTKSEHDAIMESRPAEQFSDAGECASRSAALAAARARWGEAFDRFLYETVAPGVHFSTSCSDPALMTKPEFWLAEWQSMEEGCR
jgi:hypothetical protein